MEAEPTGLGEIFDGDDLIALRGYTATLAMLAPGQFLVVSSRHPADTETSGMAPYVQTLCLAPDRYVLEVPGNDILQPPYTLGRRQAALLTGLGFASPRADPEFPENDAMWRLVHDFGDIPYAAAVWVATLTDVFVLPHVSCAELVSYGNVSGGDDPCVHALPLAGWHASG